MEPVSANGFQVFGLRRHGESKLSYLTLDEALQKNLVDVTEISEGISEFQAVWHARTREIWNCRHSSATER